MQNNYPELKPCPFCGGEAFIMSDDAEFLARLDSLQDVEAIPPKGRYYVVCDKCGVELGGYMWLDDTVNAWNTRAI